MNRKRFINQKQQYPAADVQTIPRCMEFIEDMLKTIGTERKLLLQTLLIAEEALGLIIGIYPILDMFCTMSNTTGDVAAALIVAKKEGLLDIDKYRS